MIIYISNPYIRKVGANIVFQNPLWAEPKVVLTASNLDLYQPTTGALRLMEGVTQYLAFYRDLTDNVIRGYIGNNDIFIMPNGTGVLKFGTEIVNAGIDRGKLIKMKTAAGDVVYLKTYDLV